MLRYFAQIDDTATVVQVIVVEESDCLDSNGDFSEAVGVQFLKEVVGDHTFVETRLDGSIRRFPAEPNGTYLPDLDEFRPWKLSDDFVWDDEHGVWLDPNPVEPVIPSEIADVPVIGES